MTVSSWGKVTSGCSITQELASPEDDQARQICRSGHVRDLKERPFPAIGLAAYNGHGAETLHGEDVENHQGDADQGCEDEAAIGPVILLELLFERIEILLASLHRVNDA